MVVLLEAFVRLAEVVFVQRLEGELVRLPVAVLAVLLEAFVQQLEGELVRLPVVVLAVALEAFVRLPVAVLAVALEAMDLLLEVGFVP